MIVGLSSTDAALLDSDPDTKGTVVKAGLAGPVCLTVDPSSNYAIHEGAETFSGRRFGYLHYKPAAAGSGSIIVNFYY